MLFRPFFFFFLIIFVFLKLFYVNRLKIFEFINVTRPYSSKVKIDNFESMINNRVNYILYFHVIVLNADVMKGCQTLAYLFDEFQLCVQGDLIEKDIKRLLLFVLECRKFYTILYLKLKSK